MGTAPRVSIGISSSFPRREEGSRDGSILCVETCEVEAVGQVAVVELGQKDALADGLPRRADDGRRLRAILVPRQGRAEVKRREGQVFVGLAGLSGIFAVVALVGIGVRADAGLGIVRLRRLLLWNSFRFGVLSGFVVLPRSGSGCSTSPVRSLSVSPFAPEPDVSAPLPLPAPPGAFPACKDGDLLRFRLSGWGCPARPTACPCSGRQILSTSASDKHPAAHRSEPRIFFKKLIHIYEFLLNMEDLCSLFAFLRNSLKRTNKPHGSPREHAGNRPALGWSGDIRFQNSRFCILLCVQLHEAHEDRGDLSTALQSPSG